MSFREYLSDQWRDLLVMGIQHAEIVLIAIAIASVLGVAVGLVVERHPLLERLVLATTGAMLTIPSLALFGVLVTLSSIGLGLGLKSTIVGLVCYALFPIIQNVLAGLAVVPPAIEEAAQGMGVSRLRRIVVVRLPLAWPVVLNGIRVAAVMCVGITAIAAAVRSPGFGELIFTGLANIGGANATNYAVAGLLGTALVAILFDVAFLFVIRLTTPRGIRD